jgi:CYTH domain-containing protein
MRDRDVAAAVAEAVARMRDERYDAVLHLVTAADGAEKYYTLQNNATRTETVEQAIAVDCAIREAWLGSPAHRIVGNTLSAGFEDKMDRCIGALSRQLGLPRPGAVKRFWVLRCSSIDEWTAAPSLVVRDFAVVHTYLHDSAGKWTAAPPPAPAAGTAAAAASGGAADSSGKHITNSVRLTLRRALDLDIDEDAVDVAAASTATSPRSPAPVDVDDSGIPLGRDGVPLTMVASGLNSGEITLQLRAARKAASSTARPIAESQRMLKPREYASLLSSRNPKARVVAKRRRVFVHASRSFELDEITAPPAYRGLCLLSAEANDEEEDVALPTGIEQASEDGHVPSGSIQAVEVTGDSRFLTSSLARAQGPPTSEWGRPDDAPTSRA